MGVDDLLRHSQDHVVGDARFLLGATDDVASVDRVALHLDHFFTREGTRFVEHRIRNADLADIVQRCKAGQQVDAFGCEVRGERGILRLRARQQAGVT